MLIKSLKELFERDLSKLEDEISEYTNEKDLWLKSPNINNSAGNLALHLIGNLKHFIGHVIGSTDYRRDREREFNDQNVPLSDILIGIRETKAIVLSTLDKMEEEKLIETYPIEVFGKPMKTILFIIHLQGHLNYHLGQINYHRRILTE